MIDSVIKLIDLPVVRETMTGLGWPARSSCCLPCCMCCFALLGAVLWGGQYLRELFPCAARPDTTT
ncbi:MAG: hypothetical protein ABIT36_10985 [Steroidobacteraceae bacterium]